MPEQCQLIVCQVEPVEQLSLFLSLTQQRYSVSVGAARCLSAGLELESYSRTSGESNHHQQSVSDTRVPRRTTKQCGVHTITCLSQCRGYAELGVWRFLCFVVFAWSPFQSPAWYKVITLLSVGSVSNWPAVHFPLLLVSFLLVCCSCFFCLFFPPIVTAFSELVLCQLDFVAHLLWRWIRHCVNYNSLVCIERERPGESSRRWTEIVDIPDNICTLRFEIGSNSANWPVMRSIPSAWSGTYLLVQVVARLALSRSGKYHPKWQIQVPTETLSKWHEPKKTDFHFSTYDR